MAFSYVSIKSKKEGIGTEICVDGKPLHGVRSIGYSVSVDDPIPTLNLGLITNNLEFAGEADVNYTQEEATRRGAEKWVIENFTKDEMRNFAARLLHIAKDGE